jgi:rod shape-determining protein MreB
MIYEPMAAALGAGLDVEAPEGNMVIDIGGGTTEIACISLGGIVCSESINVAGDVFTNDIQSYVRQQHNIRIGERTAEAIKCSIGAALTELDEEPEDYVVTGPNMLTALPQTVSLSYGEIAYALEKSLVKLDAALMKVLETMPPELYADIVKNGIYLAGGGALIKGLDKRLNAKTGIPFHVAEDPLRAIARGTGKLPQLRYFIRNEKRLIFFSAIPVPRAIARKGSSATWNGIPVLAFRRLSSPLISAPPPAR